MEAGTQTEISEGATRGRERVRALEAARELETSGEWLEAREEAKEEAKEEDREVAREEDRVAVRGAGERITRD